MLTYKITTIHIRRNEANNVTIIVMLVCNKCVARYTIVASLEAVAVAQLTDNRCL